MKQNTKKKIAIEILLLSGTIGLTIILTICLWCYSLIIEKKIDHKSIEINNARDSVNKLSQAYIQKIAFMRRFMLDVKDSRYASKYMEYQVEVNHFKKQSVYLEFEKDQSINGKLPSKESYYSYFKCIKSLETAYFLQNPYYDSYTSYYSDIIQSFYSCFSYRKQNLYYLLPFKILEDYKLSSKNKVLAFIDQHSITHSDSINMNKVKTIELNIVKLSKEKINLKRTNISSKELTSKSKTIFLIFLTLVYPMRFIFLTLKWAIKTYMQK
jgi:hypothetical protein